MAWRPNEQLIEGELSNETRGKVTGWMRFIGIKGKVTFDLKGDFLRDIAGCRIGFRNSQPGGDPKDMRGFARVQRGEVGDITAGLPPQPYVNYPYIEWYDEANGRVVLELDPGQVEVVEGPVWKPEPEHDAERKAASKAQFAGFREGLVKDAGCPVTVVSSVSKRKRQPLPPVSRN